MRVKFSSGRPLYGRLAIARGFLTAGQLRAALDEQDRRANQGQPIALGDLLLERGWLSPGEQAEILSAQTLRLAEEPPRAEAEADRRIVDEALLLGLVDEAAAEGSAPLRFSPGASTAGDRGAAPLRFSGGASDACDRRSRARHTAGAEGDLLPGERLIEEGLITPHQYERLRQQTSREANLEPDSSWKGRVLGGLRLGEIIGRGAMATVFAAEQISLGRSVAVKVLGPQLSTDPRLLARFVDEARLAGRLSHPHIVQVFDVRAVDGIWFSIQELLPGENLADHLSRVVQSPPLDTLRLARALAGALEVTHGHGIVHLDVKPGNILFDDQGRPKLADFGLARLYAGGARKLDLTHATPFYMAPEVARGEDPSPASDLYSLGAVLYHCLLGAPPFLSVEVEEIIRMHREEEPIPPHLVEPRIGREISSLVLGLLAKDPAQRHPANAHELTGWLDVLIEQLGGN